MKASYIDWINPIVVKELRQAVKGKFIIGIFLLFLVVQLLIIGVVIFASENINSNFELGRGIFVGLLIALTVATVFCIPSFTAIRMTAERNDNNVDLFYITTLGPAKIVAGKFWAGVILTLLIFSSSMPYMTLTYLLRGFDLVSMFILLGFDFLMVCVLIMFSICVASIKGSIFARIVRLFIGGGVLFFVFVAIAQASVGMLFFGVGSFVGSKEFWGSAVTIVSFVLLGIGLFFSVAVSQLMPVTANRSLPVRIYITIAWLITGSIAIAWAISLKEEDIIFAWGIGSVVFLCFSMTLCIGERTSWGPRLRRYIPKTKLLRCLSFLFYSGSAGGFLWSVILMGLSLAILFIMKLYLKPSTHYQNNYIEVMTIGSGLAVYIIAYSLTAIFFKNILLKKHPEKMTTIIVLLLLVAGSVLPMITGFMVEEAGSHFTISDFWYSGNPFFLFWTGKNSRLIFVQWAVVWALITSALCVPWFLAQFRGFKPLKAELTEVPNE